MPSARSFSWSSAATVVRVVRRDQGDVGGVGAQEHRFGDAVPRRCRSRRPSGRSPHSRRRSGNSGSGRGPAPRRAAPRPSAAGGWSTPVASRTVRARHRARAPFGAEAALDPVEPGHPPAPRSPRHICCACSFIRAISSAPEIPSGKPAWLRVQGISEARLLPASTTLQLQVEARQIDGRGQPGRAAADDQAIEFGLAHRLLPLSRPLDSV